MWIQIALLASTLTVTAGQEVRVLRKGTLPKEAIAKVVKTNNKQIRYCYEKALAEGLEKDGKVVVKFTVGPGGDVVSALVNRSTVENAALESCMLKRIRTWKFPEPPGGGITIVNYPFTFRLSPRELRRQEAVKLLLTTGRTVVYSEIALGVIKELEVSETERDAVEQKADAAVSDLIGDHASELSDSFSEEEFAALSEHYGRAAEERKPSPLSRRFEVELTRLEGTVAGALRERLTQGDTPP